ncbi:hypothetical protein Ancab_031872 [Ancistrocladus abbreviatus]
MTTYEPDQDGSRWGLNFLDAFPFFNCHYGGENYEHASIYPPHCMSQYHYDLDHNHVENGVEAFCQDFTQLEVMELSECSHAEEQLDSSNIASYWLAPSSMNYYPAHEDALEAVDDRGPSSSCSSPGEISYDDEDYSFCLELMDESALDGELGKRLNQMVPVPHVPRINGEIPSVDEATSDHQRLLDR